MSQWEEVGIEKPDSRIFKHAIGRVSYSQGPIWMIGDSVDKDMRGAKDALGARTFLRGGSLRQNNSTGLCGCGVQELYGAPGNPPQGLYSPTAGGQQHYGLRGFKGG